MQREQTKMKTRLMIDLLKILLAIPELSLHDAFMPLLPRPMIENDTHIAKKAMILKLSTKLNSAMVTYSGPLASFCSGIVAFLASSDL